MVVLHFENGALGVIDNSRLVAELEAFARCVSDGTTPAVTGEDALAAFDLARAAEQSWRTGLRVTLAPERTAMGLRYRSG